MGNYERLHSMIRGLSGMGDAFEFGKIYGDPAAGTALQYVEIEGLTHQRELYSTETIATMLEFIDLSSPAPVRMDSRDMVFPTFLAISTICFVLFILFFLALAYCLTILWAIQFGGVRWLPQSQIPPFDPAYWDSLAFTWSFPLMMSTCSGGSTFLYRKTGNIWTGVFTTCIVIIAITVLQCCAVPISL